MYKHRSDRGLVFVYLVFMIASGQSFVVSTVTTCTLHSSVSVNKVFMSLRISAFLFSAALFSKHAVQ